MALPKGTSTLMTDLVDQYNDTSTDSKESAEVRLGCDWRLTVRLLPAEQPMRLFHHYGLIVCVPCFVLYAE